MTHLEALRLQQNVYLKHHFEELTTVNPAMLDRTQLDWYIEGFEFALQTIAAAQKNPEVQATRSMSEAVLGEREDPPAPGQWQQGGKVVGVADISRRIGK